jgi:hypothetical protein
MFYFKDLHRVIKEVIMKNRIESIRIENLIPHPENPNRMSRAAFNRLVRNIARTGRYEPLVVRPMGERFEVINGSHRLKALEELGFESVDVIVWDVGDDDARLLLGSLNRLCGSDVLDKKVALLKRLTEKMPVGELAGLLPQTARQIERLTDLAGRRRRALKAALRKASADLKTQANPMVFFLSDSQKKKIERAMSLAAKETGKKTKAAAHATALTQIAENFIDGT